MPHVDVRNRTPFAFDAIVASDEEGVPQYVPLVQATYAVDSESPALLEEQPSIVIGGEWHGDPACSSIRLEPQLAFAKLATDVVLLGHAHVAALEQSAHRVGIRIGPLQKLARVFGDRVLHVHRGHATISREEPFETIPLLYERAFGGWDRRAAASADQRFAPLNPVGRGFRCKRIELDDEFKLPNFEDPQHLFVTVGDTPPPAGFGFVAANWQPRAMYAGTYDANWAAIRKPLLPRDFDRRYFNAASPGLVAQGHLKGDEPVVVVGASAKGRLSFRLPGIPAPVLTLGLRGRRSIALVAQLDTVVVDTEQRRLTLLWRAHLPVRNGAQDVLAVDIVNQPAAIVRRQH